jgi:hypothetical protein
MRSDGKLNCSVSDIAGTFHKFPISGFRITIYKFQFYIDIRWSAIANFAAIQKIPDKIHSADLSNHGENFNV